MSYLLRSSSFLNTRFSQVLYQKHKSNFAILSRGVHLLDVTNDTKTPLGKKTKQQSKYNTTRLVDNARKYQLEDLVSTIDKLQEIKTDIVTPVMPAEDQPDPSSLATVDVNWNQNLATFKKQLAKYEDPNKPKAFKRNVHKRVTKKTKLKKESRTTKSESQIADSNEEIPDNAPSARQQNKSAQKLPIPSLSDFSDSEKTKNAARMLITLWERGAAGNVKERALERDQQWRNEQHNQITVAYIDTCIHTGMLKKAQILLSTLYFRWRSKTASKKKDFRLPNIEVYNLIMHAGAEKGEVGMVRRLFQQLTDMGLTPTLQTYAAVLQAIGNSPTDHTKAVSSLLVSMMSNNLHPKNIARQCSLTPEELTSITKAVRSLDAEFTMDQSVADDNYDCPLLNHLNHAPRRIPCSINPHNRLLSVDTLQQKFSEQLQSELQHDVKVKSVLKPPEVTDKIKVARELLTREKKRWRQVLTDSFLRNKEYLERQGAVGPDVLPYLKLLSTEEYVDLMLKELDVLGTHFTSFNPPLDHICFQLSQSIFNIHNTHIKLKHGYFDKIKALYPSYLEKLISGDLSGNHRQMWTEIRDQHPIAAPKLLKPWPYSVCIQVGKFMLSMLLTDIKIDGNILSDPKTRSEVPALYRVTKLGADNRLHTEITTHPALTSLYTAAAVEDLSFSPTLLPSLVPAQPWTSLHEGANFLNTVDLVKKKHQTQKLYSELSDLPSNKLYPVMDALNAIGATPWRINKKMLDIMVDIFNSGGDEEMDVPLSPDKLPPLPKIDRQSMTPEEVLYLSEKRKAQQKQQREMYSLWCSHLYMLSIANKYRDEIFWLPHHLDFRGRVYAVPPYFNHIGGDAPRGLMLLGEGKPLGSVGLDWLKIHLINLTGFKKRASNQERLEFCNEMMHEVYDSADNPIQGRRWWLSGDNPWQILACCMELSAALRSPHPEQYISHLPVHQDGTCNGLQHYAALGRDRVGAESVNLRPSSPPKDVYSDILELVEKEREKDDSTNRIARMLDGHIKRKVVKQTIMTTVYGLTPYGAREQITGQLKDLGVLLPEQIPPAAVYLSQKTFQCLEQIFTSTRLIQEWLVLCAHLISQMTGQYVSWTTPLGLPVIQHYKVVQKITINDKRIQLDKPNSMKQRNALPPNFIHSLDACHLMLTALGCLHRGVSFVAVHDSFWTHAASVPDLNKVCREQFVALHKQPILENLAAHLQSTYSEPIKPSELATTKARIEQLTNAKEVFHQILGRVPKRGTFDIDEVLDSTYFFS